MENNHYELEFENQRLEQTISLAKEQLIQAKLDNEQNKSAIVSSKQEMRENSTHSVSGLWNSDNFEALVELSQYANQITNKIADFEAVENRIALLNRLIVSPYFARIDFKFDDEDMYEKIYIGRSTLAKEDSYEIFVYDWRSPIASVFYRFGTGQAFYESPNGKITGEVNLKRQFEINNGKIEYFFDADVHIIDEFLRKLLSQNTSSKMKTIVETIQKEQDIVIRDMQNDLMMVQGVAGSGKTSIALHRAAYLMYQGLSSKLSANNIVIISPNSLFEQYISNVLPELGENNVASMVFDELLSKILNNKQMQTKNQFLEYLITSTKNRDIIKSSIEFKNSQQFYKILTRYINDLPTKWIQFEDICFNGKCVMKKEVLKEKILSGRKETPLAIKLKQLEDFVIESMYDLLNKRHNKKIVEFKIKKEMQKYTELNIAELYRKLFYSKKYFFSLAKGLKLPENINDIINTTRRNLHTGYLYYDDALAIAFFKLKATGKSEFKHIKQVVVDEAQDYYRLHYEILNFLFPNSKYTILGDINQTLEKKEDLTLYEQISNILKKKKSILVTMDKSFRCTNEILKYSSKFIEQQSEIKSFNREGDEPKIHQYDNHLSYIEAIISEITHCQEKGYKSIGLICKTEKSAFSLYESIKDNISINLIKNDSVTDLHGTFIIPVYMSKGLEFDAVLICDADNENYYSEDDKKLLYIACTRALHRLNLFCKGSTSTLL